MMLHYRHLLSSSVHRACCLSTQCPLSASVTKTHISSRRNVPCSIQACNETTSSVSRHAPFESCILNPVARRRHISFIKKNRRTGTSSRGCAEMQAKGLSSRHSKRLNRKAYLSSSPTISDSGDTEQLRLLHPGDDSRGPSMDAALETLSSIKLQLPTVDTSRWVVQKLDWRIVPKQYLRLAKARLTGLIVITAASGYFMCPEPFSFVSFALCCSGTAALAACANTINQFFEVPFDSQMKRTQARVLVRKELSPIHGVTFAAVSGSLGFLILTYGLNPLTGCLGLLNLVLYTSVYTPLKRISIMNTWIGAIVGAVPPLMGWAAASGELTFGALVIAAILYAWQFPHFNALSWNLRGDYSRAGYRMMCVTRPDLCTRTTLRYSCALLALCSVAAPLADLTTLTFAIDSIPLNAYLIHLAWRFQRDRDSASSRKLFRYSLVYLPAIMLLMGLSRSGHKDNGTVRSDDDAVEVIKVQL